jgi:type III secretion system FlhB-like substrate exporter
MEPTIGPGPGRGGGHGRFRRRKLAVALRYDRDLPAPFLCAKGDGVFADRIKRLAEEFDVPVIEDPTLASAIFPLDVGDLVPESWYEAVAAVFAAIARMERT